MNQALRTTIASEQGLAVEEVDLSAMPGEEMLARRVELSQRQQGHNWRERHRRHK